MKRVSQYEQMQEKLLLEGMHYAGSKKRYCGKVQKDTYFSIPGLIINTFGYYQDCGGNWVVFVTDDDRGIEDTNRICRSEEEAIQTVYELAESYNFSNLTSQILDNFGEKIPSLITYLNREYDYTASKAQKAIDYLLQEKYIAFEFLYYVEHGEFVPDCFACNFSGYTAKDIYHETELTILGAFNYMVYLKKKPHEAVNNLKKGLPMRKVYSETELKEVQPVMDEKKPVQVEESAEPQQPAPEAVFPQKELLDKLEALQQAVAGLQQSFDDKIAEDAHKNGLFDNMHRELTKFQNGAMDKIVDTMALDIIQLVDTTKGHVRVYEKKEATEDNYKRLLRVVKGIAEDLQDILYRQNIESYRVEGHQVDVRRQKIIQTMPTDDQSKDNLVAVRAADGYEKDGKVLRPERIKIFKYTPNAAESTDK